jgi:hypothetical protein
VDKTAESEKSGKVKVVKIAPEHLGSNAWIAYRLDTSDWIDEIRFLLERDGNARLSVQVAEMQEADYENLPVFEGR